MNVALNNAKLATLNSVYAAIVNDYAPAGFELATFKAKASALDAINAACEAGSLAVEFDGDSANIIDLMGDTEGDSDAANAIAADDSAADDSAADDSATDDSAADDSAADDSADDSAADDVAFGDGKGKAREWGFVTASDAWLKENARGTEAREAYRKERRKAARMARKAQREAKEAAKAEATE